TTWRERALAAMGPNAALLVDLVPELRLVVGPAAPPAPSPPTEALARFSRVVQKFVSLFATSDHPLVLFLDDVHWSDVASLKLIAQLAASPVLGHLLIVLGVRSEEATTGATDDLLREANAERAHVEKLALRPLEIEDLAAWLGDTLRC